MAGERILVVDDEPGVRSMLQAILRDEGYAVDAVGTGEDGLRAAGATAYDALLLDVWLPGLDGVETLSRLRQLGIDAEVVMISGHGTIDTAVKATKAGAFDFIEKPLSLEKTILVVRNALRQRRLEQRNRALLGQLSRDTEILGDGMASERVRRAADAAGASDSPVLICGEAGSGRETVARHVHAASRRGAHGLVHVSCGALDTASGGSVLFGDGTRPGRLDLAEKGSVYLEDIDRLPPELQLRVASWSSGHPDVRILAGAAGDPAGIVQPLRDQLDVIRIAVTPLRERREDVPGLVTRFMRDLASEYGRSPRRISHDAMAVLVRHEWPGNLRELRNMMERLLLLAPHDEIRLGDLPVEVGGDAPPAEDLYGAFPSLAAGRLAFDRYFFRKLLREEKGDVEAAARRAGTSVDELRERAG